MKNNNFIRLIFFSLILVLPSASLFAQKRPPVRKKSPIVFAVLNDGKTIEPIGLIEKGELVGASDGGDESKKIVAFTKTYYPPKMKYKLVFGGVEAGIVTVSANDPTAECAKNMADITVSSSKAKLKGMVMGLAINAEIRKAASGVRRLPTAAERSEIEALVRAEFVKQKISAATAKNLKYHNLTALDVDGDGKIELVGSFWVEPSETTRALLFFIAEKAADGKYAFGYSDYRSVGQDDVMSGADIKALDTGVYHELLLDVLEYDGDASAEIFTYTQGFEGAGFTAYARRDGKWIKAFEGSNYHCAF